MKKLLLIVALLPVQLFAQTIGDSKYNVMKLLDDDNARYKSIEIDGQDEKAILSFRYIETGWYDLYCFNDGICYKISSFYNDYQSFLLFEETLDNKARKISDDEWIMQRADGSLLRVTKVMSKNPNTKIIGGFVTMLNTND